MTAKKVMIVYDRAGFSIKGKAYEGHCEVSLIDFNTFENKALRAKLGLSNDPAIYIKQLKELSASLGVSTQVEVLFPEDREVCLDASDLSLVDRATFKDQKNRLQDNIEMLRASRSKAKPKATKEPSAK